MPLLKRQAPAQLKSAIFSSGAAKKGIDAATMLEIAELADVGAGTV
jgi:AcrR family transcriptional regulator